MAVILDGNKIAEEIRLKIKKEIAELALKPKLAIIRVGDDEASVIYVKMKQKACEEVGIESLVTVMTIEEALGDSRDSNFSPLKKKIRELNLDPSVSGILVQLPLPKGLDPVDIIWEIDPKKDVDCLHPFNIGRLIYGKTKLFPCTAKGSLELIKSTGVEVAGKTAVVVGRSNLVGKPIAEMLLQKDATVIICHSKTKDLQKYTKQADILVVAVGKAKLIKKDMVKKGAVVIDVGISRENNEETGEAAKLSGDVDFDKAKERAFYITPMPGGVGPMTVAMLLENILLCHQRREDLM